MGSLCLSLATTFVRVPPSTPYRLRRFSVLRFPARSWVTTKIGLNRATLPVSPIDKPLGSLSIQPVGPITLFRSANTMLRDALGGVQRHPTTSCACHRSGLGRESVIANPEHLK